MYKSLNTYGKKYFLTKTTEYKLKNKIYELFSPFSENVLVSGEKI